MLWRRLLQVRAPARLGRRFRELDRAQRELARLQASLPATKAGRRLRGRCLEVLQAQNAELERVLGKVNTDESKLVSLLQQQLQLSRATLDANPEVSRLSCWTDGPHLPEVLIVLLALALSVLWTPWLFFPCLLGSWALAQLVPHRAPVELEFDGRSLRVIRRVMWLWWFRSNVIDLAEWNEVEVTALDRRTQLAVVSAGHRVVIDTQPDGRQVEQVVAQVRKWCAIAAREP